MEPPPKSNNFDRLSDLPDFIFHHILSFLDIKQVARVSTLSRRCRKVCLSSPFLTIDLKAYQSIQFNRFNAFLHRFMFLRNGAHIHQFKVELHRINTNDDDEAFQMGNWVLEATRCNVEKIYLKLNQIEMLHLPSGVLNCASLRVLDVDMAPYSLLILPPTSFGGLESLSLRHLSVSVALFGEWVSSLKSLKMLDLLDVVSMHLNISSSSLEKLILVDMMLSTDLNGSMNIKVSAERLRYLCIEWWDMNPQRHSLTLDAPKLEQFIWDGEISHYSYEGNFDSLSYSSISVLPCPISNDEHGDLAKKIFGKVLQMVYQVSSICIYDHCIKALSSHELLPEFCNLLSLTLIRTHMGDEIPSRVSLLNSMPHLNTLKIHWFQYSEDEEEVNKEEENKEGEEEKEEKICYNSEYWESENLEFVRSLKEVEMDIKGEENEIELIKYLLKNAKSLKKMTILYPSELRRQSVISRKIQQFQIASSSIALYFLQK